MTEARCLVLHSMSTNLQPCVTDLFWVLNLSLTYVSPHREHILKTAKALVEDTKLLVSGAGASQEKLAQAAQSSVLTITKLADVVKLGAASLGSEDPETQVGSGCYKMEKIIL